MSKHRFFKRLKGSRCYPAPVMSIFDSIEYDVAELIRRLAFTAIGAIMLWWSWTLLAPEISKFPNVEWLTVIVGIFTLFLGIRNILSIFKGLTWGQVFLTLVFVAVDAYLVWFA